MDPDHNNGDRDRVVVLLVSVGMLLCPIANGVRTRILGVFAQKRRTCVPAATRDFLCGICNS
jgi:hypothetical protein